MHLSSLATLVREVSRRPLVAGNHVLPLVNGDINQEGKSMEPVKQSASFDARLKAFSLVAAGGTRKRPRESRSWGVSRGRMSAAKDSSDVPARHAKS
jgi:hypothetical protein